jgi:hypothetical protein
MRSPKRSCARWTDVGWASSGVSVAGRGYLSAVAKGELTRKDLEQMERAQLQRLREDYRGLSIGQRVEQQAALSATLTALRAAFAKRQ